MTPLVSIIIPSFNREELLSDTLDSVMNQTYSNWECIIVDDGSTDSTLEVAMEYAVRDARISFLKRPPEQSRGAASCRNVGLEKAKGDFIQFLDSDDLLHKDKLFEQFKIVDEYSDRVLYTCKWGGFEDMSNLRTRFKYKVHSYKNYSRGIGLLNTLGLYNEFFPPHVYLIPKRLLAESGYWDEDLTNNDDAEFFTRIILKASKIVFVPDATVYYRYHSPNNLSSLNSEKKIESAIKSWELIEKHIKEDNLSNSLTYVKRAKATLFDHLKTKQPQMLLKYTEFFSDRNNYDSNYYKYLKKLKQLF